MYNEVVLEYLDGNKNWQEHSRYIETEAWRGLEEGAKLGQEGYNIRLTLPAINDKNRYVT